MKKLIGIILLWTQLSNAYAIDINRLIIETQKAKQTSENINMVWWIPKEFWGETLKQDQQISDKERNQFVDVLEVYMVFAVINADTDVFGGLSAKTKQQVDQNTQLFIDGEEIPSIALDSLNADARAFFNLMKPLMGQMLGEFGKSMHFVVYPNKSADRYLIDASKKGSFTFESFGEVFSWRLPLASLMPAKFDPNTKEEFPGNYNYNPYTGTKLINGR
ncbi:hypothetical protein FLL45_22450 [Aliikangiella marina]|uniref:Uncharacterized protein n=1 Tax=Aliikangiella marina TaxID=1712262 RepID=A0A545T1J7_9GAMM|nr:hypothetical protein [Aliikangiella marina]TQV71091.1 hypothetical protein FLL45_22450 [Aliikangiella marina]